MEAKLRAFFVFGYNCYSRYRCDAFLVLLVLELETYRVYTE